LLGHSSQPKPVDDDLPVFLNMRPHAGGDAGDRNVRLDPLHLSQYPRRLGDLAKVTQRR